MPFVLFIVNKQLNKVLEMLAVKMLFTYLNICANSFVTLTFDEGRMLRRGRRIVFTIGSSACAGFICGCVLTDTLKYRLSLPHINTPILHAAGPITNSQVCNFNFNF
jgi:hypothetical protein